MEASTKFLLFGWQHRFQRLVYFWASVLLGRKGKEREERGEELSYRGKALMEQKKTR
jgi:hypothetical protein